MTAGFFIKTEVFLIKTAVYLPKTSIFLLKTKNYLFRTKIDLFYGRNYRLLNQVCWRITRMKRNISRGGAWEIFQKMVENEKTAVFYKKNSIIRGEGMRKMALCILATLVGAGLYGQQPVAAVAKWRFGSPPSAEQ
jgi:hypothetical protein